MKSDLHVQWKIIRTCKSGRYQYCVTEPRHPRSNSKGLYPLHRVVMENFTNRSLRPDEHVHHKDGNRFNNTIDNLELLSISDHTRKHHPRKHDVEAICGYCGSMFLRPERVIRRSYRDGAFGVVFCSRSCGARHSNYILRDRPAAGQESHTLRS